LAQKGRKLGEIKQRGFEGAEEVIGETPARKGTHMSLVAERDLEHLGETRGMDNHDHDVIHGLSKRLDALWRYDQYIANADGYPELEKLWRDIKRQDQENVNRLKKILGEHAAKGCF